MRWVLTTHPTTAWIDVQLRQLRRWGWLEGARALATVPDPGADRFDLEFPDQAPGTEQAFGRSHQRNLDFLTKQALKAATSKDRLVVLDGDAFPVAPFDKAFVGPHSIVTIEKAGKKPALREFINCAFLTMPVKLWLDLGSPGWGRGHYYRGCNDTNGKLQQLCLQRGIKWTTLRRSNKRELYYPYFGVYGGAIYHHGSGFRPVDQIAAYERQIVAALWQGEERGRRELCNWKARLWELVKRFVERNEDFQEFLA